MKKAFTLIELLIVVAIIAILAAIAVPNFLEAQVRSKVSRMKADMRSVATAMESYAVDNNKYPVNPANSATTLPCPFGLMLLSTPIAYMTNPCVKDVFMPEGTTMIMTGTGGTFAKVSDYDLAIQYSLRGDDGNTYHVDAGISGLGAGQKGSWWLLRSYGPDKDADAYSTQIRDNQVENVINAVYDPTNGTVSNGNVYRVGGAPSQQAGQTLQAAANR